MQQLQGGARRTSEALFPLPYCPQAHIEDLRQNGLANVVLCSQRFDSRTIQRRQPMVIKTKMFSHTAFGDLDMAIGRGRG